MIQKSVAVRDAQNDAAETAVGAAPLLKFYDGSLPADCAASIGASNTLASGALPSNWLADSASGVKSLAGSWTATGQAAAGTGTLATYFRIWDAAGTTCHYQGTVKTAISLTTSALTAAHGNVLNFAATTGVAAGMTVSGTGIPTGTTVESVTGTTVTLSQTTTAGVSSATSITFGGDMNLDNVSIANAQVVTVTSWNETAGNA